MVTGSCAHAASFFAAAARSEPVGPPRCGDRRARRRPDHSIPHEDDHDSPASSGFMNTQRSSGMPIHRYRAFPPIDLPDRTWPTRTDHPGAAVALDRPARRQPGADRPDEPGPQAEDVRAPGPDGLQGDRGRLPQRQRDGLRLRPPADRERQGPRGRHDLGAHAGPRGPDRAHRPLAGRRAPRQHPPLQRAGPAVPPGRLPRQQGRDQGHRGPRHRAGDEAQREHPRQDGHRLRVQPRDLHRHRAAVLRRGVRGGLATCGSPTTAARSS